jgi:hypothetical protein
MLSEKFSAKELRKIMMPTKEWRPFPKAEERKEWEELLKTPINQFRYQDMIQRANIYLNHTWPLLPAHLFMEFVINGNRSRFEELYFSRRKEFSELVLAECLEFKGRFINDILNGFWAILEETSWCIPAHHHKREGDPLPDPNEEIVDLFAAQTAMIIGEAFYLLGNVIHNISPNLCLRIKQEIKRRVLVPYMASHKTGWDDGHNNWSIWCSANILGAAMYTVDDIDYLSVVVSKLLQGFDKYYRAYANDGGCDEGPNYWGVSPGIMTIFLELLHSRTNGEINIYKDSKIVKMANFIVNAHISKNYYFNFADASAITSPDRGLTYKLGEMTEQTNMQHLVGLHAIQWNTDKITQEIPIGSTILNLMVRDLFWFKPLQSKIEIKKSNSIWYPDTEILICRDSENADKGMYFAIKAGHNGENHNHNDVGHFILFLEGRPAIIDVGVETYSKETFGPNRYSLTYMKSSAHNIAVVNGQEQKNGKDYKAKNVSYSLLGNVSKLEMNLESLYPKESQMKIYQRKVVFDHSNGQLIVTDKFEFLVDTNEIIINFYCQSKPVIQNDNSILLLENKQLIFRVNHQAMIFNVTEVPIADARLLASWKSPLYKLSGKMVVNQKTLELQYFFEG